VISMTFSLDQIADGGGKFAILAMDQRGTLRKMLEKAGRPAADRDLSAFKVDVIAALSSLASGVLTDMEYGVAAVRAAEALHPDVGLLIASDRSPQPVLNGEHRTEYASADRGPSFAAAGGGVALKFLVRWRPDRPAADGEPDLAREAMDAVRAVIEDCRAYGMPSVIEPLVTKLPSEDRFSPDQRKRMVVRSAELLAELGPDLLKLEWPGDEEGCREVSKVCGDVPWALLSAGVEYERFVEQVLTAMDGGASGYIAGRSFWGEAVRLTGAERREFLETTAATRMANLNAVIKGHGRTWREVAGR
jgi:tagatose 1,6-diphosphate aldolase/sulfofructosephosphate aldolase